MPFALWLLLLPFLLYGAVTAALYICQISIFFPSRLVPPAGPLPPRAERIDLTTPDGVRLEGVLILPSRPGGVKTAILGFAGNASNTASTPNSWPRYFAIIRSPRSTTGATGPAGDGPRRRDCSLTRHWSTTWSSGGSAPIAWWSWASVSGAASQRAWQSGGRSMAEYW